MNRTREVVESSLLVALAVVLFLASYVLPVVGMAFALVCPAPLVVLGLRHSLGRALLGVFVASFLVSVLTGVTGGLFFLLSFGMLGVGLGFFARRLNSSVEILLYGVLVSLAGKLLLMVLIAKITGINPLGLDGGDVNAVMDNVLAVYQRLGMSKEALGVAEEQIRSTLNLLPYVFPALLIMASALDSFLSYVLSRAVMRRIGKGMLPPVPALSYWRFPKNLFWALLVAVLFSMASSIENIPEIIPRIGMNLRILVMILFYLQGLAVAWAYLCHKGVGKVLRYTGVILTLFVPLLTQVTLLLGIIDMWFDLRSRMRR
ncbi:MAG: YybS family protein [Thermovirgaceae bacterium]